MYRILLILIGSIFILGSCTQRLICPAYQSAFIYDKDAIKKKFSYLKEDSTPKIFTASSSKSKYLVAVPESYRKKLRALQTVEMKPIYPEIPDSLKIDQEGDLLLAERDLPDSIAGQPSSGLEPEDSAYAITKAKEKFNVEQDNYMWYFRNVLVLPDVRAAMESKEKKEESVDSSEKKGPFKFFKNLFSKEDNDTTAVTPKDSKRKTSRKAKKEEGDPPGDKSEKKDPAKKDEGDGF
jgi:hypothetical protein